MIFLSFYIIYLIPDLPQNFNLKFRYFLHNTLYFLQLKEVFYRKLERMSIKGELQINVLSFWSQQCIINSALLGTSAGKHSFLSSEIFPGVRLIPLEQGAEIAEYTWLQWETSSQPWYVYFSVAVSQSH